jgi:hypothetical protein
MACTGTLYLWTFIGFVKVDEEGLEEGERRALFAGVGSRDEVQRR